MCISRWTCPSISRNVLSPWQVRYKIQFFWKSYFGNVSGANLLDTLRPRDSVFVCFFCLFFIFLNSRRSKPKIILAIFEHTCHSMILVIIKKKKIKPIPSKDEIFPVLRMLKKMCHRLRISKFAFPKCFKQWSHHEGMCSLSNWLLWMKQQFLIYKFLVCLHNPITRFRVWFHFLKFIC